jgi:hypothetical protein
MHIHTTPSNPVTAPLLVHRLSRTQSEGGAIWLLQLQIRRGREDQTQVYTVNSNSPTSNCQCSLFSKKNPIIRNFCISGWIAVPINPDKWSSTVLPLRNCQPRRTIWTGHVRRVGISKRSRPPSRPEPRATACRPLTETHLPLRY